MASYEEQVKREVIRWKVQMKKRPGSFNKTTKKLQTKINSYIPEKVHHVITESVKKMIQGTLIGSEYTTKKKETPHFTLEEKEKGIMEKIQFYKRTAAIEGAGTGARGFFLGLADFPLLLAIKMKLLFEMASIYGLDINKYEERLYILQLFQLAFSSEERRIQVMDVVENWESKKQELIDLDWRVFQQEYRDYIDLVKLFQMVPVIGAAVGAYANYNLLDHLGTVAMNGYRLRLI
ncbi:MAG TPA: ABC transporter-associated protein EcsC [Paenibacillaceae bacterium]|nr:ABC transporter-associated protein EcsC [Paenibacillaceae bacterium]